MMRALTIKDIIGRDGGRGAIDLLRNEPRGY